MKYKELKLKTDGEVKKMLEELRIEAHDLFVKLRLNQLKNTHKQKAVKKDIARIMTYLSNK